MKIRLRWEEFVFAEENFVFAKREEKTETRLSEGKSLTSLNNWRQKTTEQSQLSPKDEVIKKIDEQKLKNEGLDGEKNQFALVVEKGCNDLNWG